MKTPESQTKEMRSIQGRIGEPLVINLEGESNVPPPGPGLMKLDHYDSEFLEVRSCTWIPPDNVPDAAVFQVVFKPLHTGVTEVNFTLQPRAINPLFMPVTYQVTIV